MSSRDGREDEERVVPRRSTWVLLGFMAIAGYFLSSEHRAHAIAFLPYLLVLACPLMHILHGHGRHGTPGGAPHRQGEHVDERAAPPPSRR